jgi:hypothetical protein
MKGGGEIHKLGPIFIRLISVQKFVEMTAVSCDVLTSTIQETGSEIRLVSQRAECSYSEIKDVLLPPCKRQRGEEVAPTYSSPRH